MASFRTEIGLSPAAHPINPRHPVLTAGSCFADAIGQRLNQYKFKSLVNPFGVTYNPCSIHTQLRYAIHNQPVPDHTYLEREQIHLNYNFHSQLASLTKGETQKQIQEATGSTHYFLKDAKWLMITYGTAWAYLRKDTGEIVANCHKMPQSLFDKELLSQKKILDSFEAFYRELKAFNTNLRIILTVSPVRHIKDTLEMNSVSKSVLRLVCHTLSVQHDDVDYFPAFELLMDDLRDYRFYSADMIHPSSEAENYIWQKFSDCYFDVETKGFIEKWSHVHNALHHRPFQPASPAHQKFLKELLARLEGLRQFADVEKEIEYVKAQLI